MPRLVINVLSARRVQTEKTPGRHADGGGLYLVVDPSGAKRWVFLYRHGGKRREMGLGGIASVPLAKARERAAELRLMVASGRDPINAAKPASAVPTFGEATATYISDREASWRSLVHKRQWEATLALYARPINRIAVDQIATDHVLQCIRPIWSAKPETASRVRGRIERVLDAQKAAGNRAGENPARWRGHLEMVLPRPKKLVRGHHASMPYRDVPAFVARLRARPATSARMLEFVILTAARSGEVRKMRWQDIAGDVWTVPADQMKAGRAHRVPLPERASVILSEIPRGKPGDLVWPNRSARPMTDMVFKSLLTRMGIDGVTTHGFRASFKDWASDETTHAREIIEAALAHVIGDKAEQAYRRSDALDRRRKLLHDWAAFLEPTAR
jgi:integrase